MAMTLKGNRTGRAGAMELAEQREMIYEEQEKSGRQAKRKAEEFGDLVEALRELDPKGWSQWYDEHLPDWLGWRNAEPALMVLRERVKELLKDALGGLTEEEVERLHVLVHESSVAQTEGAGQSSLDPAPFERGVSHERPTETVAECSEGGA